MSTAMQTTADGAADEGVHQLAGAGVFFGAGGRKLAVCSAKIAIRTAKIPVVFDNQNFKQDDFS